MGTVLVRPTDETPGIAAILLDDRPVACGLSGSGSFTCALRNGELERLHLLRLREARMDVPQAPGTCGSSGPSRSAAPAPARPAPRPACCARDAARGSGSTSVRRRAAPRRRCGPAYLNTGISAEQQARQHRDPQREQQHRRIDRNIVSAAADWRARWRPAAAARHTQARARRRRPPRRAVTLSASSSRAIRPQLAPSATRIANSCCRPSARTSSRLATLAQAISSTMPMVPISTHSTLPISPITSCFSGRTLGAMLRLFEHLRAVNPGGSESCERHRNHARDIGVRLLHRDPGFEPRHGLETELAPKNTLLGSRCMGTKISGLRSRNRNRAGNTPMTSRALPSIRIPAQARNARRRIASASIRS